MVIISSTKKINLEEMFSIEPKGVSLMFESIYIST